MTMAIFNTSISRLTLAACIGFALAITAGFIFFDRGPKQDAAHTLVTNAINEKVAALNVKSRTSPSIPEKIALVRAAISRRDFSTAQQVTAEVLADSHVQNWRFYPFNEFVSGIVNLSDPSTQSRLDEWVGRNANDPIPWLVRGQYNYDKGWSRRGHGFSNETRDEDLVAFEDYMQKALVDIDAAERLNNAIPYSFELKLQALRGGGRSQEMMAAFEAAIKKFPAYYPLYQTVLSTLQPKWGGTTKSMYDFVEQYAGSAPKNSPLKLLYLNLYADLLNSASMECLSYKRNRDKMSGCVTSAMERVVRPELEKQVQESFRLYDHTDRYQFGIAVKPILVDMLDTTGGEMYAGAVLQWAAEGMHSDTQLVETTTSPNDYIIDLTVADSWYNQQFYDNALKKSEEALKDLRAASFPSGDQKDLAVAKIYTSISHIYGNLGNYVQMIAYDEAAIALGGRNGREHSICYGYYRLKQFDEALQACARAVEANPENLSTFYWRGQLYRDMARTGDALQDLERVAASNDGFRQHAAIDISTIYFDRKDNQKALEALNKYTYLYDPNVSVKDDVAVAYNNRCYAYMELGDLRKALDDCTASLKFGNLPDAYRKHEELVKRLDTDRIQL